MPIVNAPITNGFYVDPSKPISAQECANWIVRVHETDAQANPTLIGTPGISLFATATNNKFSRGAFVQTDLAYSVNGDRLYRINSDGTVADLGEIQGSGRVSMASNGNQLCIVVPGAKGYIYTVSGGLAEITDTVYTTTLGPSQQVVYKDGYFIHFNNRATTPSAIFFISALNDGTTYNALDFASAEVDPDKITGIHVNRNVLYVGGTNTIEPVQNIGGDAFPFQRIEGAVIQKGVLAKFSLVDFAGSFVFVGSGLSEQPAVWQYTGGGVSRISTGAIDEVLRKMTSTQLSAIYATTYASRGGFFVNFHLNDRTFTYDASSSSAIGRPIWHERKSKNSSGELVNWRVNNIIDAYGFNLVTDSTSGRVGKLDDDVYTEYGDTINRAISGAFLQNQGEKFIVKQIELTCESGVGNIVSPGDDPEISRFFSDDGGVTFSGGSARKLGKQGEYWKRQIWMREGQVRRTRVYKFVHDSPVRAVIIKLECEVV